MARIVRLPPNIVGSDDRRRLESFGGHTIARGRATRWHWDRNMRGDDVFEIYTGGENEVLAARISRDRKADAFSARDASERSIASGTLEHVFAKLEGYFAQLHGETGDTPA